MNINFSGGALIFSISSLILPPLLGILMALLIFFPFGGVLYFLFMTIPVLVSFYFIVMSYVKQEKGFSNNIFRIIAIIIDAIVILTFIFGFMAKIIFGNSW